MGVSGSERAWMGVGAAREGRVVSKEAGVSRNGRENLTRKTPNVFFAV